MRDQDDLADHFFDKKKGQKVDFEVALAAFLATFVLTYPPSATFFAQVFAVVLLLLTLIRRIVIASPFSPTEKRLQQTLYSIEISTTIVTISIFISVSEIIRQYTGISTLVSFIALSTVGLVLLVVIEEFLFRDYFTWWYVKFSKKADRGNDVTIVFSDLWELLALISREASLAYRNRPARDKALEKSGNRLRGQKQLKFRKG